MRSRSTEHLTGERTPAPEIAMSGREGGEHVLQHALGNAALASRFVAKRACCTGCGNGGACSAKPSAELMPQSGEAPETVALPPESSAEELAPPVRDEMESSFGADFSGVRIHRDAPAARAAADIHAKAFTVGQDVYFGAGFYDPQTAEGRLLLAHELAHAVQQPAPGAHGGSKSVEVGSPFSAREREAEAMAARVAGYSARAPELSVVRDDFAALQHRYRAAGGGLVPTEAQRAEINAHLEGLHGLYPAAERTRIVDGDTLDGAIAATGASIAAAGRMVPSAAQSAAASVAGCVCALSAIVAESLDHESEKKREPRDELPHEDEPS